MLWGFINVSYLPLYNLFPADATLRECCWPIAISIAKVEMSWICWITGSNIYNLGMAYYIHRFESPTFLLVRRNLRRKFNSGIFLPITTILVQGASKKTSIFSSSRQVSIFIYHSHPKIVHFTPPLSFISQSSTIITISIITLYVKLNLGNI